MNKKANVPVYRRGDSRNLTYSPQNNVRQDSPRESNVVEDVLYPVAGGLAGALVGAGLAAAAMGPEPEPGRTYDEEKLFLPGAAGAYIGYNAGKALAKSNDFDGF
jgi:hypothetical protein